MTPGTWFCSILYPQRLGQCLAPGGAQWKGGPWGQSPCCVLLALGELCLELRFFLLQRLDLQVFGGHVPGELSDLSIPAGPQSCRLLSESEQEGGCEVGGSAPAPSSSLTRHLQRTRIHTHTHTTYTHTHTHHVHSHTHTPHTHIHTKYHIHSHTRTHTNTTNRLTHSYTHTPRAYTPHTLSHTHTHSTQRRCYRSVSLPHSCPHIRADTSLPRLGDSPSQLHPTTR